MRIARHSLPALWLALLAVLLQLVPPSAAMAMAPPAMVHICGVAQPADHQPAPSHGGMDCDHCPFCASLGVHAVLLPAPPPLASTARPASTEPFSNTHTGLPPGFARPSPHATGPPAERF